MVGIIEFANPGFLGWDIYINGISGPITGGALMMLTGYVFGLGGGPLDILPSDNGFSGIGNNDVALRWNNLRWFHESIRL
jgi:hypothetical protein